MTPYGFSAARFSTHPFTLGSIQFNTSPGHPPSKIANLLPPKRFKIGLHGRIVFGKIKY